MHSRIYQILSQRDQWHAPVIHKDQNTMEWALINCSYILQREICWRLNNTLIQICQIISKHISFSQTMSESLWMYHYESLWNHSASLHVHAQSMHECYPSCTGMSTSPHAGLWRLDPASSLTQMGRFMPAKFSHDGLLGGWGRDGRETCFSSL